MCRFFENHYTLYNILDTSNLKLSSLGTLSRNLQLAFTHMQLPIMQSISMNWDNTIPHIILTYHPANPTTYNLV